MKGAHGYHLTRAWLALLALSLGSAALTVLHLPAAILGAGILLLALIKARMILAHYLDMTHSPAWLRGFAAVFAVFSILIFALYLI